MYRAYLESINFGVSILIIRFSLLLVLAAVASFSLTIALDHLTMTHHLAEQASQLGSIVMLSAFLLLLFAGLGLLGKLIIVAFYQYFSTRQRMERKILFYISKHNRLKQLFYFKKARLLYVRQQKRKHLLKKYGGGSITS